MVDGDEATVERDFWLVNLLKNRPKLRELTCLQQINTPAERKESDQRQAKNNQKR